MLSSSPHWSQQINHTVFCKPCPSPHLVKGCFMYWDTGDGKQDTLQKLRQRDKVPHTSNNSANELTNRHREVELLSFHSIGVPSSTAREYPFPSGQPRGKEAGNVAGFGAFLFMCVCVYLLISHQWGKLQHLFLFLPAHDTQPASLFWLRYATNSGRQVFWQRS